MVNMGELFANRRIRDIPMERVPLNPRNPERDLLRDRDLLFARQSIVADGAGKVSIFEGADEPVTYESHLVRARIDPEKADPRWLFYFFESSLGRNRMQSIVHQVAAAGIRGSDLMRLPIPHVDLDEQHRVAGLLDTLDNKIDSNRRLAKTLEEIAAALFKARFVDFVGQNDLLETEACALPRGWSWQALSSIANVLGGGTPKTTIEEYWGGSIPWISVKDTVPGPYVIKVDRHITEKGRQAARLTLYPADTVVITARGTVGNVALMSEPMTLNQSCYALRSDSEIGQLFLFHSLRHAVKVLRSRAHGSVFSTITRSTFDSVMVAVPPEEEIVKFEQFAEPIFARIRVAMREAAVLAEVRDALLPRLIAGQIQTSPDGQSAEKPA
jgi:type I restriction enzyme S subunit